MNASEVSEDIVYYFFKVTHIYIDDLNVARETTILAQITLVKLARWVHTKEIEVFLAPWKWFSNQKFSSKNHFPDPV